MTMIKDNSKLKKARKWRLIVRNAAFSSTEEDIRKRFNEFGQISEIVMPQKKNHFAGFCFVQFVKYPDAVKAMKEMNGKLINDRVVAVDWAVPKDQYMTAVIEEKQNDVEKKLPQIESETYKHFDDEEKEDKKIKDVSDDSNSEEEEDDDDDNEETDSETEGKKSSSNQTKSRPPDPALEEGRTLFVRCIPFEVDEEKFKETFQRFGEIKYALICKYPNTDHSKGSGFVQFLNKADADACLNMSSNSSTSLDGSRPSQSEVSAGLFINNQRLVVCKAVEKSTAKKFEQEKHEKHPKDNRNLHLLRVGLLREGTKDAQRMSKSDASKRLRIEAANRQKIKNLHIFASPTRLCLHNLPTKLTDKELKSLCLQAVDDPSAKVTECRIMRDLKRLNTDGVGKSRGFAFVEFVQHEHAYKCLKNLNNNPSTFSDEKRPIVEFSLENRLALNTKQKRLQASRVVKETNEEKIVVGGDLSKRKKSRKIASSFEPTVVAPVDGAVKLKSTNNPFPSHIGPKIRHRKRKTTKEIDVEKVEKLKKKKKIAKKMDADDERQVSSSKTNNIRSKTGIKKRQRRQLATKEDTDGDEYSERIKKQRWFEDKIGNF